MLVQLISNTLTSLAPKLEKNDEENMYEKNIYMKQYLALLLISSLTSVTQKWLHGLFFRILIPTYLI